MANANDAAFNRLEKNQRGANRAYARHRFAGHDLANRSGVLSSFESGLGGWLAAHGMDEKHMLLSQLYKNWDLVLGEELCATAHPLGHRNATLLIGCDDSCAMQELSYAVPEILDRVNAFMNENFFTKVEFQLRMGRNELRKPGITSLPPEPPRPQRPENLGGLNLPADSPVAACYQAYVRFFQSGKAE